MTDLSDIKAECTRDESRMDSQHGKIDKFSSDKGGGTSANESGLAQSPVGKSSPNFVAIGLVIAVVAAVILASLLIFEMTPANESPTDAYREYVDASNDKNIKRMFDQTVTRFTDDYESRLENLSDTMFHLNPKIEIVELEEINKDNITILQELEAQVLIPDLEYRLSVTVEDFCYLQYTVNITYQDIDQGAEISGEVLCVMIDGHWYLAIPGFY